MRLLQLEEWDRRVVQSFNELTREDVSGGTQAASAMAQIARDALETPRSFDSTQVPSWNDFACVLST